MKGRYTLNVDLLLLYFAIGNMTRCIIPYTFSQKETRHVSHRYPNITCLDTQKSAIYSTVNKSRRTIIQPKLVEVKIPFLMIVCTVRSFNWERFSEIHSEIKEELKTQHFVTTVQPVPAFTF